MPLHKSKTHLRLAVDRELASEIRAITAEPKKKAALDRRMLNAAKRFLNQEVAK